VVLVTTPGVATLGFVGCFSRADREQLLSRQLSRGTYAKSETMSGKKKVGGAGKASWTGGRSLAPFVPPGPAWMSLDAVSDRQVFQSRLQVCACGPSDWSRTFSVSFEGPRDGPRAADDARRDWF
jgi:hypothetical protein